jgi:hypothetical protein
MVLSRLLQSIAVLAASDTSPGHNLSLEPDGPSLIQPEVFPGAVGHIVARPAVGDLVGDHISKGFV